MILRRSNVCAASLGLALRVGVRLRYLPQFVFLLSACLLVACSSQPSVLAMIFDMPPPGQDPGGAPVIHTARRTPFVDTSIPTLSKEYVALMEEQEKAGPPPNWPEIFKKLPKDDDENIDWMAALEDKVIQPSPGIDPKTPEGKTSDDEVELSTSGKPAKMVIFSHLTHTKWLSCSNCHPAIFKKEGGNAKITMKAIDDGKYCGVCHDTIAIAQPSGCNGCHKVKKKS